MQQQLRGRRRRAELPLLFGAVRVQLPDPDFVRDGAPAGSSEVGWGRDGQVGGRGGVGRYDLTPSVLLARYRKLVVDVP